MTLSIDSITPFFILFRNEDLPLWLSLGIFCIGLLFFLYYTFFVYTPVRRSLRRACRNLESISGYTQFCSRFSTLDSIFTDSGLKHSWDEFKQTLILPGPYDEDKVVRNTIRPFKYFNFETLSYRYNMSLFQSIPGIIVGIGLLLTFCGLVSAIYLTSESIGAADAGALATHTGSLRSALDDLLHIAAFKFLTSIAGLITSILLTIQLRICNGRLRREYDRLNTLLERNLIFESQEQQNARLYTLGQKQLEYLRRQSDVLDAFTLNHARDTAKQVTQALHAVGRRYASSLGSYTDSILAAFADRTSAAAKLAMTQLVQDFSTLLHAETGHAMKQIAESLTQTTEILQSVTVTLQNVGQSFGNELTESARTLQERFQLLGSTIDGTTEKNVARMEELVQLTVETFAEKVTKAATALSTTGTDLAERISGSALQVEGSLKNLQTTLSQATTETADSLQKTFVSTNTALARQMMHAVSELERVQNDMAETNTSTTRALETALKDVSRISETLDRHQKDLLENTVRTVQTFLEGTFGKTREDMILVGQTVRDVLQKAAQTLHTSLEDVEKGLSAALTQRSEKITADLTAFETDLKKTEEKIQKTLVMGEAASHERIVEQTAAIGIRLEQSAKTIQTQLESVATLFSTTSARSTEELSALQTNLAQSLERAEASLSQTIRSIQESVQGGQTSLQDHLKATLTSTTASLETHFSGLMTSLQGAEERYTKMVEKTLFHALHTQNEYGKESASRFEDMTERIRKGAVQFEETVQSLQTALTSSLTDLKTALEDQRTRLSAGARGDEASEKTSLSAVRSLLETLSRKTPSLLGRFREKENTLPATTPRKHGTVLRSRTRHAQRRPRMQRTQRNSGDRQ